MIPNLSRYRYLVSFILTLYTLGCVFIAYKAREYVKGLPPINSLDNYTPSLITRIYDINHQLISELYVERRSVLPLTHIPVDMQRAILATEDDSFYSHPGIDIKAIIRAFIANLRKRRTTQGGSTITQQLAKNIFLTQERTIDRKIKELLLTLQIERNFSKDEILQMYLNQIYFGHGAYGVEAAARVFFGKNASELNLGECALLAGLPKAPGRYSPINHLHRAIHRRNLVLKRMRERKFITEREELQTVGQKLIIRKKSKKTPVGAYFVEAVRKELGPKYGVGAIYREGLSIYTTLDLRMQKIAEEVVKKQMDEFDKQYGEQRLQFLIKREKERLEEVTEKIEKDDLIKNPPEEQNENEEETQDAIPETPPLTKEERKELDAQKISTEEALQHWKDYYENWSLWKNEPEKYSEIHGSTETFINEEGEEVSLEWPEPVKAQIALVAVDPKTGGVRTMVGGRDFKESEFNRARQAKRQPGSTFKPFVWLAALESGFTAASIIKDQPIAYTDVTSRPKLIAEATSYPLLMEQVTNYYEINIKPNAPEDAEISDYIWAPQSWDHKYLGPITLRRALAWSRNLASVRLTDLAGPRTVIEFSERVGIKSRLAPVLSLGLGSSVVTVEEIVGAFGTFANNGVHNPPFMIQRVVDKNGTILEEHIPEGKVAISPQSSYLLTRMLQAVIHGGTGRYATRLRRPVAGKTGTTQEQRDVWFMGYIPDLAAGVWIGYDDFIPLGKISSSRTSVPLWTEFMKEASRHLPTKDFAVPPGIVFEKVDANKGCLALPFTRNIVLEAFLEDNVPQEFCPDEELDEEEGLNLEDIEIIE